MSKKWYQSKTVLFNIITLAIGILGVVNQTYQIDPKLLVTLNGIGNIFLRLVTSQPIQ